MRAVTFLASMALLAACDPDLPPPRPVDSGPPPDAGPRLDAGPPPDAGPPIDAGPFDGGPDTGVPMLEDAGIPAVSCVALDDPPLSLGADALSREGLPVAVPTASGFGVLWVARETVPDVVRFLAIPSSGAVGSPVDVASVGIALPRVALARLTGGTWLAAWTDNSPGNYEVSAQSLSASGGLTGGPRQITVDPSRDDQVALLATADGGALATWVRTTSEGASTGHVRSLAASGAPVGTEVALGVAAPFVLSDQPSPSAYWIEDGQAFRRSIGPSGLTGTADRLDTEGNVASSIGASRSASLAAAAFAVVVGVRSEVRFRPLDSDGAPRAPERAVTPPPQAGVGPAIGSLGGGNVVAYRAVDGDAAHIRLRFVSTLGALVGDFDAADASITGGPVALAIAGDGRLLVVWRDETDAAELRAVRVECSDAT